MIRERNEHVEQIEIEPVQAAVFEAAAKSARTIPSGIERHKATSAGTARVAATRFALKTWRGDPR
jgi:hypothetical protein